jgi:hypothetical protein
MKIIALLSLAWVFLCGGATYFQILSPQAGSDAFHYVADYLTFAFLMGIAFGVGKVHQRVKDLGDRVEGVERDIKEMCK